MRRNNLNINRSLKSTNFYVRSSLNTDFRLDGLDFCKYIRYFMPDTFVVNFIYVFFDSNALGIDGSKVYRYDFVFCERWLNHTSLNRLHLNDYSLYRVYTHASTPTIWQNYKKCL